VKRSVNIGIDFGTTNSWSAGNVSSVRNYKTLFGSGAIFPTLYYRDGEVELFGVKVVNRIREDGISEGNIEEDCVQ